MAVEGSARGYPSRTDTQTAAYIPGDRDQGRGLSYRSLTGSILQWLKTGRWVKTLSAAGGIHIDQTGRWLEKSAVCVTSRNIL